MSEFDLIRTYFSGIGPIRSDVPLGVGDDCALLRVPAGAELAVSVDTLVAGIHFFSDCDPAALGHKSLAVGLSDLASMGAEPAWATLALTLPRSEGAWLGAFAAGLSALARDHGVQLVGGDTTRGPLSVTVQVHGFVPEGQAIRRDGACQGDLICVSGTLGDAGLVLREMQAGNGGADRLRPRLERPTPRVALGMALRGLATAMIDVSDGLVADLGHITEASGVGAEVRLNDLPLSPDVAGHVTATVDWSLPLSSGDDYELCFTLPAQRAIELGPLSKRLNCPLSTIGCVTEGAGVFCVMPDGSGWDPGRYPSKSGYNHFPDES